jgi:hypothetical protein
MPSCTLVGVGGGELGKVRVESVEEYAAGGPRRGEIPNADEILVHFVFNATADIVVLQHHTCSCIMTTTTVSRWCLSTGAWGELISRVVVISRVVSG